MNPFTPLSRHPLGVFSFESIRAQGIAEKRLETTRSRSILFEFILNTNKKPAYEHTSVNIFY